jgi:hypothetical protein
VPGRERAVAVLTALAGCFFTGTWRLATRTRADPVVVTDAPSEAFAASQAGLLEPAGCSAGWAQGGGGS